MANDEARDTVPDIHSPPSTNHRNRRDYSSGSSLGESTTFSTANQTSRATTISLSGPSQEEQANYYVGLGGSPLLLARSSTNIFSIQESGNYQLLKRYSNIGQHQIIDEYDRGSPSLRLRIRRVLRDLSVEFLTIDVLRIGFSRNPFDNPVVVLVKVRRGAFLLAPNALDAVKRIRAILLSCGLSDVHAEIMSVDADVSVGMDDVERIPRLPYEQIPCIGQSIGPADSTTSGSLGLYITIQKPGQQKRRFGLTCHHVVFSGLETPAEKIPAFRVHDEEYLINQPSTSDHEAGVKQLEEEIRYYSEYVQKNFHANYTDVGRPLNPALQPKFDYYERLLNGNRQQLAGVMALRGRCMGRVYATSGIHLNRTTGGTSDWALIELDTKHRFTSLPANKVPAYRFDKRFLDGMNDNLEFQDRFIEIEAPRILEAWGSVDEIKKPRVKDQNGVPTLRVLKYGRTTHWTFGTSIEIMSDVTRSYGAITKEWCILDENNGGSGPFSKRGDSGSIIFDYRGRILGMVTGGFVPRNAQLMTFATPFEWLAKDIERSLGVKLSLWDE